MDNKIFQMDNKKNTLKQYIFVILGSEYVNFFVWITYFSVWIAKFYP